MKQNDEQKREVAAAFFGCDVNDENLETNVPLDRFGGTMGVINGADIVTHDGIYILKGECVLILEIGRPRRVAPHPFGAKWIERGDLDTDDFNVYTSDVRAW